MPVKLDMSGWDDFNKKLEQVTKTPPTLTELFPDSFISEHTDFKSFQEMLDASGLYSPDLLDSAEWSQFVARRSRFSGWQPMYEAASGAWHKAKLDP